MRICGHKILVRPNKVEEKSAGGIILMTDTQKKMERAGTMTGTVIDIGPTAWKAFDKVVLRQSDGTDKLIPGKPWADIGDKIYYSRYGGVFVEDENGEELIVLNDEDVIAILEDM